MERINYPETTYLNSTLHSLKKLRSDQRCHVDQLIAFMRGSSFGTAVLDGELARKIAFSPDIREPRSARVNIGRVRLTVHREARRIVVSAKER